MPAHAQSRSEAEPWLRTPTLRRLHEYWTDRCPPGRLPGRADMDPLDIIPLLPDLLLLDVVCPPPDLRLRVRLVGTHYIEMAGRDSTGRVLDDIFPPERLRPMLAAYAEAARARAPHYWKARLHTAGREHVEYERLTCPLATDGETVDMFISVFSFLQQA